MADRVVVPRGVPKLYVRIYEQVEDKQHPKPIALELEGCIKREISKDGDGAKKLINIIVPQLKNLNSPLFRGNEDFKYEILQRISEEEREISGNRLHIERSADACRYVCNMLGDQDIKDISVEVNVQYHLNICDARLNQIQIRLLEETEGQEEQSFSIKGVRDCYEKHLRNPKNRVRLKGNEDLLKTDITLI